MKRKDMLQTEIEECDQMIKHLIGIELFARERIKHYQIKRMQYIWLQQWDEARKVYPDLWLRKELEDEEFKDLLCRGRTVQQAYEEVHKIKEAHNEILSDEKPCEVLHAQDPARGAAGLVEVDGAQSG